jgi:hypothetical protein
VRIAVALGLIGIWQTASLLHGSLLVTAAFTLGAAALGLWAVTVLRDE